MRGTGYTPYLPDSEQRLESLQSPTIPQNIAFQPQEMKHGNIEPNGTEIGEDDVIMRIMEWIPKILWYLLTIFVLVHLFNVLWGFFSINISYRMTYLLHKASYGILWDFRMVLLVLLIIEAFLIISRFIIKGLYSRGWLVTQPWSPLALLGWRWLFRLIFIIPAILTYVEWSDTVEVFVNTNNLSLTEFNLYSDSFLLFLLPFYGFIASYFQFQYLYSRPEKSPLFKRLIRNSKTLTYWRGGAFIIVGLLIATSMIVDIGSGIFSSLAVVAVLVSPLLFLLALRELPSLLTGLTKQQKLSIMFPLYLIIFISIPDMLFLELQALDLGEVGNLELYTYGGSVTAIAFSEVEIFSSNFENLIMIAELAGLLWSLSTIIRSSGITNSLSIFSLKTSYIAICMAVLLFNPLAIIFAESAASKPNITMYRGVDEFITFEILGSEVIDYTETVETLEWADVNSITYKLHIFVPASIRLSSYVIAEQDFSQNADHVYIDDQNIDTTYINPNAEYVYNGAPIGAYFYDWGDSALPDSLSIMHIEMNISMMSYDSLTIFFELVPQDNLPGFEWYYWAEKSFLIFESEEGEMIDWEIMELITPEMMEATMILNGVTEYL